MSTDESESETMARDLPRDIIIDILSRLPVRSVLRFKCVCKSWYALFKDPNFITKHFNRTTSDTTNTCFLYTPRRSTTTNNCNRSISLLSNDETFTIPINLNIPFLRISKPFRISGTCDGLVCLSVVPLASIILLWNPATRVFKDLPTSPIARPNTLPIKVVLGFGFDQNAKDYKLLRIVYYCYPLSQVEVYSLSTNSWREIKTDLRCLIFESSCSVFLKGRFHWTAIGFQELNGRELIVSFDMGDEVFCYTKPPPFRFRDDDDYDDDDDDCLRWHLVVFKECLGMIICSDNGPNKKFDIWVMNEYGVAESWTKHISFGPYPGINRPMRCGKKCEVLLEKDDGDLVLYDPTSQTTKDLGAHGVVCWSDVFIHVESLLPIKGGKVAERFNLDAVIPDFKFVRKFDLVLM
uniref:Putative F-box protein CPR30-like n=1 Tax=Davidia involucrata TaxID=16924 RepID=A0A5B7AF69_DAVIN